MAEANVESEGTTVWEIAPSDLPSYVVVNPAMLGLKRGQEPEHLLWTIPIGCETDSMDSRTSSTP